MKIAIQNLRRLIYTFSQFEQTDLKHVISKLKLEDLNHALYRCDQEERDGGAGFDVYNIPKFGSLVYAGFQGKVSVAFTLKLLLYLFTKRFYVAAGQY